MRISRSAGERGEMTAGLIQVKAVHIRARQDRGDTEVGSDPGPRRTRPLPKSGGPPAAGHCRGYADVFERTCHAGPRWRADDTCCSARASLGALGTDHNLAEPAV